MLFDIKRKRFHTVIEHGKISKRKTDKTPVKRVIKNLVKYDTMDRQKGSGRPRTVATRENEKAVEDLV